MRMNVAAVALSSLAFLACSSTASGPDGSAGAGGTTATGGAPGAGGAIDAGDVCATATFNQACTVENKICNQACTDVCAGCSYLMCSQGHWQRREAVAVACFACGPNLRCPNGSDYCYSVVGGPVGNPPSYQCRIAPDACLPNATCSCLRNQNVGGTICSDAAPDGGFTSQITVTLEAP